MTEELTTYKPLEEYSDEQIRMYKRTLNCQNATSDEWSMLELMSSTYQLNPFLREIWLIPGVGVMVGLAGFLKLAHRSGRFAGMETTTEYKEGRPYSHTTRVWLKDTPNPVTKTIIHEEFQRRAGPGKKPTKWDTSPVYMGEKTSEVHALKRAFSLIGLYCPEEMGYEDITEGGPAGYTGSVNGEPVKVEPMKKGDTSGSPAPAPVEETPKCSNCGGALMDRYESNQMQDAWDENGWGTVPAGLCKACVTKVWRACFVDVPKTTPTPVQNDPGAVAKAAIEKTRKKEYQT